MSLCASQGMHAWDSLAGHLCTRNFGGGGWRLDLHCYFVTFMLFSNSLIKLIVLLR